MGWLVKRKTLKSGVEKFRIYSTMSDGYLTKWETKEGILKFIFWNRFYRFMDDMIKESIMFPNKFTDKDTYKQINEPKDEDYYEFAIKACKDNNLIPERFEGLLKGLDIELFLRNEHGEGISTRDEDKN